MHFLNPRHIQRVVEHMDMTGSPLPPHIQSSRRFRKQLNQGKVDLTRIKIVTLTRDPIGRDLSSFVMNKANYSRTFDSSATDSSVHSLIDIYMDRLNDMTTVPDSPLTWFENELNYVFGIDVYATEFPTDRGWKVYDEAHPHVLLIRSEDLERCASDAFRAFLGIDKFELSHENVAENKQYGELYKRVLDAIRLPSSVLDTIYGSRYMTHFYSGTEIASFKKRWEKE